jgi:hypothetical protein
MQGIGLLGAGLCLALMAAGPGVHAAGTGAGAYLQAEEWAWSQGLPVLAPDGDWSRGYQPRSGEQRAYATARAELGVAWLVAGADTGGVNPQEGRQHQAWRLGGLVRADATARLSGQAAQILYHYQSRTDPDQSVELDARTRLLYWAGRGVALHTPAWAVAPGLRAELGWDHLSLSRLRSLRTSGQVAYDAGLDGYHYQGELHDENVQERSPFLVPPAGHGIGDALSVWMDWRPAQSGLARGWWPDHVALQMQDAWSRLSWAGVHVNDGVLNSQVSQRDADGHIAYSAAIHGQLTRRTVVERIPVQSSLAGAWERPEGCWGLQVQNRLGLWQRWLSWSGGDAFRVTVGVEPVAKAWRLGGDWRQLQVAVMGSRTDQAAHVRGFRLGWVYPL